MKFQKVVAGFVASVIISMWSCGVEKECEASDWSTQDTILQSAVIGLIYLDWMQTNYIYYSDDFYETNQILNMRFNPTTIAVYMSSMMVAHTIIAVLLPPKYRAIWQAVIIGMQAHVVYNNYQIGCRFRI